MVAGFCTSGKATGEIKKWMHKNKRLSWSSHYFKRSYEQLSKLLSSNPPHDCKYCQYYFGADSETETCLAKPCDRPSTLEKMTTCMQWIQSLPGLAGPIRLTSYKSSCWVGIPRFQKSKVNTNHSHPCTTHTILLINILQRQRR